MSQPKSFQTEIRDGKEMIVISADDFNKQFKKKRVSQKQRILEQNGISLKYLNQIQYRKKEATYSFKITNIPSITELIKLIAIQEEYTPSDSE
jgi:hypothetical protein